MYVKRDVPRMLVKTFSAAWLSSRNSLRFLGIVIVYPGDSGLRISFTDAAYPALERIFGFDHSNPPRAGNLPGANFIELSFFLINPSEKIRASAVYKKNFSFISFFERDRKPPRDLSASQVSLSRGSSLICYVCFLAYLFANVILLRACHAPTSTCKSFISPPCQEIFLTCAISAINYTADV